MLFNRILYKKVAKAQLKNRWKTPVLSTLIILLLTLLLGSNGYISEHHSTNPDSVSVYTGDGISGATIYDFVSPAEGTLGTVFFFVTLAVTGVLIQASAHLYIRLSRTREPQKFGVFIEGFSNWANGILGFLWYMLWVMLWTIVFFVPGIVKSIAYSQMFFILDEHPDIGVRKAMRVSKEITKGYKGELFLMGLSFLGWEILNCLTMGILSLWLRPYESMSYTNAYHALMSRAIKSGEITEADLRK